MRNPEILILLIVVGFLVFGAKRMPDAARGLGRSLRIFKAETKGLLTDDETTVPPAAPLQIPQAAPVQQVPVAAAPAAVTVPAQVATVAPPIEPVPVQPVIEQHDAL
ncbi:MAG TPA: Sec-independent protein translocase subunit TatA [Acidothermaceae bacterium]|jgi:sec-independent protein translocase protein TatA